MSTSNELLERAAFAKPRVSLGVRWLLQDLIDRVVELEGERDEAREALAMLEREAMKRAGVGDLCARCSGTGGLTGETYCEPCHGTGWGITS